MTASSTSAWSPTSTSCPTSTRWPRTWPVRWTRSPPRPASPAGHLARAVSDRIRRLITALLAVVLGSGAALLVLIFFNARDESTFTPAAGPGQALPDQGARHIARSQAGQATYATDPPASGPPWPEPTGTR